MPWLLEVDGNDDVFYRLNVLSRSSKKKFNEHLIFFGRIILHFIECKIFNLMVTNWSVLFGLDGL